MADQMLRGHGGFYGAGNCRGGGHGPWYEGVDLRGVTEIESLQTEIESLQLWIQRTRVIAPRLTGR